MPATFDMTWEPTRRRWAKMEGGKRVVVSVRQLSKQYGETIPETKEGSYRFANRWWEERSQAPSPSPIQPRQAGFDADGSFVMEVGEDEVLAWMVAEMGERGIAIPENVKEKILGSARREELRNQVDAILNPVKPPADRTVGAQVGCYLEMLMSRHRAGDISVSEYSNARAGLNYFRDWVGSGVGVDKLTPDRWQDFYLHLIGPDAPESVVTRRKHFRFARNFLQWMDDLGIHPSPKNLDRKQYRFKGGAQAVPTIATEVVRNTVDAARGQLKLHLLLMLNCGFTQQDISDLRPSEIDWEHGRIRRKRSKTGNFDKVPMVDYVLWSLTFTLLKRYRSSHPDHVLLTESGRPWMRDGVGDDGSRSRTDAIQSNYRKLVVEGKQPMKMLRKAGGTMLDTSSEHGRYAQHFLGQANTVATKHYISQNGPSFDAAVKWLGQQFGF